MIIGRFGNALTTTIEVPNVLAATKVTEDVELLRFLCTSYFSFFLERGYQILARYIGSWAQFTNLATTAHIRPLTSSFYLREYNGPSHSLFSPWKKLKPSYPHQGTKRSESEFESPKPPIPQQIPFPSLALFRIHATPHLPAAGRARPSPRPPSPLQPATTASHRRSRRRRRG